MMPRSSLVIFAAVLSACGRPALSESTLTVSVLREGALVKHVWLAFEDERYPCGRLDATVTLNGVALRQQSDGTSDRGLHLIFPLPGCQPPSFELEPGTQASLSGPFELVVDAGGERVVMRSEGLLTVGYVGPAQVAAGAPMRLSPSGVFQAFRILRSLAITGPGLARDDQDEMEVSQQKWRWTRWEALMENEALVATVPADLPAGTYTWSAAHFTVQVPVQQCEGVRSCDVRLGLDVSGVVTVTR
ncbi:MAG: hypothetical protein Q8K32_25675 [Archangium sp.]|nr:hypothetical protein [Archangium sp.]